MSYHKGLLQQCAENIKRWPRRDTKSLPALPDRCSFISGISGYKILIAGRVFTKEDVNKEKKRIPEIQ